MPNNCGTAIPTNWRTVIRWIDLLLRLLKRRVSSIPAQDEQRVRALTSPQRESLGDALAGFRTNDDLADWLGRQP